MRCVPEFSVRHRQIPDMQANADTLTQTAAAEKGWVAVYADLIKARLTLLVLLTTLVGFSIGWQGQMNYLLMFHALLGTALVASGAAALNQLFEREYDASRPVPRGLIVVPEEMGSGRTGEGSYG